MSRKIKFHTFHVLFRLFAYLADKSGGWMMFVRPKLLIGSIIVGLGLTGCGTKTNNKPTNKRTYPNFSKKEISKTDSIPNNKTLSAQVQLVKCYTGSVIIKDNIKDKPTKPDPLESTESTNDSIFSSCYIQISVKDYIDAEKKPIQDDKNKVYTIVQQMPQFPGGEDSLLNFISKNLKYPNTEDDYMGRVICRFIVNKDGSVSNIEVVRSLETSFDAEAIKVLKLLPNFIPGKQNGNPVRVYYTLPISFKID